MHRDTNKGGNGIKIQVMGSSHHFIVSQVALFGVSDNCDEENQPYALYP